MKKTLLVFAIIFLSFTLAISANEGMTVPEPHVEAPDPITTRGPEGEVATWYTEVELTAEEVEKIREMELTAAYELVTESEWSRANLRGFQDAADFLNIEIVGIENADLDPMRQRQNMENFQALQPDIVTAQAREIELAHMAFDPLVEAGTKLVFLSNVPTRYEAGNEYVSALTSNLEGLGRTAAELINEALDGEGTVISISHAEENYVTNTRDDAFREAINEDYLNIELVAERGFDDMGEAGNIAMGALTSYPDVDSIYVSFSGPGVEVLEALRSLGMDDVAMVTLDLEEITALDLVRDGNMYGYGTDLAYTMGYTRAMLAAYGFLDKTAPSYVDTPAYKVTKENIRDVWEFSFGVELPDDISSVLEDNQ